MGIKWNEFRCSPVFKLFLFIMLTISTGMVLQSFSAAEDFRYGIIAAETQTDIVNTEAAQINHLFDWFAEQGSESYIRSGAWIDSEDVRMEKRSIDSWLQSELYEACDRYGLSYSDYIMYYGDRLDAEITDEYKVPEPGAQDEASGQVHNTAPELTDENKANELTASEAASYYNFYSGSQKASTRITSSYMDTPYDKMEDVTILSEYDLQRLESEIIQLRQEYEHRVDNITAKMIANRLRDRRNALKNLEEYTGLRYSINGVGSFSASDLAYTWDYRSTRSAGEEKMEFQAGFTHEYYDQLVQEFRTRHAHGLTGFYFLLAGCFGMLLFICLIMATAGYRRGEEGIVLGWWDRLYLDLNFLATGTVAVVISYLALASWYMESWRQKIDSSISYIVVLCMALAVALALTYGFSSFAKRFKRREVIRHTLAFSVISFFVRIIKKTWRGLGILIASGPAAIGPLVFIGAYGLISFMIGTAANYDGFYFFIFMLLSAAVTVFILWRVNAFNRLKKGVSLIRRGELSFKLPETGGAALSSLAADINCMSEGLARAVESEVRSERMKTQLITNVSHDLKTPLTSIISYADLLSTTELGEEKFREYTEVIKRKSEQLKRLVEDLFEVSKAQSGAIGVNMETLCINDLVMQAVGEWEEKLSPFVMRINLPEEKIMIRADGTKMWRVLSNLLHNIAKYSQQSSRVYIDLTGESGYAQLTFKNISNYEMNFEPEMIVERFRRGDEARSGEGSGLGLSIAQSFIDLQGGKMDITIDGDLFKVILKLPYA